VGLDSRLNVTYARKLGFKNLLTITFSQSNAPDESIAKKIAADYGFEFMFLSLDHGNYLKELEKPVHANDGLILYAGSAHLLNMISFINWSRLGLLQMGLGAALLKGSYLSGPVHERFNRDVMAGAGYSKKLVHKLSEDLFKAFEHYENDEIFLLNERDIHGMFNGYRMIEHFTDFASPFLDVDFLDYCLKIPPDLRFESKIYFHLMNTFVPEASEYIWEHTGYKINTGKYSIKFYAIMKRLYKKIYGDRPGDSMNPTEYWFRTNSELREVFRMYWEDHRSLLNDYPSIKEDAAFLFNQGTTLEKTQALTLLSAVKLLQLKKG
jgi:asparagine synthase (glutamine-hydrolysing)